MNTNSFLKNFFLALIVVFFASCDSDFNEIGSDVLGNDTFNLSHETIPVIAYNQKVDAVSTTNLPTNLLGIRNSPFFGKTKASFVTQLSLATLSPVFGANVVVDSVVLSVPYFLKTAKTVTKSDLSHEYTLDSIYGTSPINLKVYENGYYLRDTDLATNLGQRYYSNQNSDINSTKIGNVLNNSLVVSENTSFLPRKSEFVKYKVTSKDVQVGTTINYITNHTLTNASSPLETGTTTNVETRSVPKMHLRLDNALATKIIIAPPSKLASNVAFKEYFRGLYFQVDDATDGTMMSLDFSKGDVTIYYREDKIVETKAWVIVNNAPKYETIKITNEMPMKTLVMNMTGNTANFFDVSGTMPEYTNALVTPDRTLGDKKLYLKGGQGSQAYLELNNDVLNTFKNKNYLINQATLTFTIDNTTMTGEVEPQRIFIFDADNKTPLIDYTVDQTTNATDTKLSKYVHNGIIQTDSNKRGTKYVINITQHITNIIKNGAKNVRLGIVVTESINLIDNSFLKTLLPDPIPTNLDRNFDRLPKASVMSSLGTVLYGSNNTDIAKNIEFKIDYTKPKQN